MCTLHVRPVQPAPLSFPPVSLLLALPPSLLLLSKTHQDACSEFPFAQVAPLSTLALSAVLLSLCSLASLVAPFASPPPARIRLPLPFAPSSLLLLRNPTPSPARSVTCHRPRRRLQRRASKQQLSLSNDPPFLSLKTSALFPPPTHPASPAPHVVPLLVQSEIVRHGPHAQPLGRRRGSASQRVRPNQSVLPARPSHTTEPLSLASSTRLTRPATPPPSSSNLYLFPNSLFLPEQR